jgi:hypothetical protein
VLFIGGPSEPTALVAKQARELGFKGGFLIMDQAKLDEMAKVTGGLAPLEGSIGVLPVSYDDRAGPKAFAAAYRKAYGADKDPTTESSYKLCAGARTCRRDEDGRHDHRRRGHSRKDRRRARAAARGDQRRLLQGCGRRGRHHRRPIGGRQWMAARSSP